MHIPRWVPMQDNDPLITLDDIIWGFVDAAADKQEITEWQYLSCKSHTIFLSRLCSDVVVGDSRLLKTSGMENCWVIQFTLPDSYRIMAFWSSSGLASSPQREKEWWVKISMLERCFKASWQMVPAYFTEEWSHSPGGWVRSSLSGVDISPDSPSRLEQIT